MYLYLNRDNAQNPYTEEGEVWYDFYFYFYYSISTLLYCHFY